jgi:glycosyltransferase involved in cell wall biosynthesis
MRIINTLFNYKKSTNDNKILGVERCFIDYSKHLMAFGNEVVSVTQNNMVYCDEVRATGSRLVEVPAFGKGDIYTMLRMAWLFFKFKPEVIICHSGRALFFARVARLLSGGKAKIVGIDHGVNPRKFLEADYALTVNSYFSKELIRAGMPENRALVIPNMIEVPGDFDMMKKEPFANPIRLGALGRLYPEKNFAMILKAMKILQGRGIEAIFSIGGVGVVEQELSDLAKELDLEKNFKLLGWTNDKKSFFNSIDIFILPSLQETFGIVLLEAMLYSTPIITSNTWGPDEIIKDGINGLKISIDNPEAVPLLLADAIEKMVKNETEAKKMAETAYKGFFENYSAEMVGKKLNEIMGIVRDS